MNLESEHECQRKGEVRLAAGCRCWFNREETYVLVATVFYETNSIPFDINSL